MQSMEVERARQAIAMREKLMLRVWKHLALRKIRGDKKAKRQLLALLYGASLQRISQVGKRGQ